MGLEADDGRPETSPSLRRGVQMADRAVVYESGKPSREVRAGHDIAQSTLQRWVQGIRDSGSTRAADNRTSEQDEPVELRRCDRRLEVEVDVSEQAAPVFARRQA